jgi:Uma2 family endonuclease
VALSPSTARFDRTVKRPFYQRVGVPEYWIVDLDARLVERWRPSDERPEIIIGKLAWRPDGAQSELLLQLEELWEALPAE